MKKKLSGQLSTTNQTSEALSKPACKHLRSLFVIDASQKTKSKVIVSLLNFFDRSHGLRITAPFNFDFLLLLLLRINIQDRFTTQEDSLVWWSASLSVEVWGFEPRIRNSFVVFFDFIQLCQVVIDNTKSAYVKSHDSDNIVIYFILSYWFYSITRY